MISKSPYWFFILFENMVLTFIVCLHIACAAKLFRIEKYGAVKFIQRQGNGLHNNRA